MTLTRRRFLEGLGLIALAPACAPARRGGAPPPREGVTFAPAPPEGVLLNDVHSRLNETRVSRVVEVSSLDGLHGAVTRARDEGLAISIAGGGHSMGGQQYGAGAVHLDTRRMNRVLGFDRRDGFLKVEAGIQCPELVAWTVREQEGASEAWGIAQKQSGADRLTVGGALSCNAHGRGLAMRPIVDDVDSFTLIDGNGGFRTCSRAENQELFRLAIGGYGLFGVIYSVRLRL
ncbi:MAG: FAD-binding oxidoreductase, partial [Candidatus Binatia bacterium]